ncbi:MAG: L-histidine N(alpha)-methyltransferase [Nitrosarchaeum sp.]|uniref:L-histidine N(alpha)-methyltransferase n=1 Tax=Nitrosarchaeum sp. TaxID=2026886 RepID=UPI002DF1165C|nr:L-histidine N(alpha)-methyltransferase [Nitrosarchaeum sp.]
MSKTIQNSLNYKKYVVDSKLQYFKPNSAKIEKSFADEVSFSLTQNSKFINPKFFYDKKGSDLFEKICDLSEYYPTRTEISILQNLKENFAKYVDDSFRLVELGSGSSVKTRLILDILNKFQDKIEYFPIDISEILTESSSLLQKDYKNLHITGIIDTYEGGLEFLKNYDSKKNLIIFLGSSFGNFIPADGKKFLKKINSTMKDNDLFLIGLDLVKNKETLENAYNDSKGITAQFNLNVLSRINDELDADFNLNNFTHYARYNEDEQRIEMYLKSLVEQFIVIPKANLSITLKKDELIHTEHSHKYKLFQIKELMNQTGFDIKQIWLDENNYFALTLVSKNS